LIFQRILKQVFIIKKSSTRLFFIRAITSVFMMSIDILKSIDFDRFLFGMDFEELLS
jgi:hypothetical protein